MIEVRAEVTPRWPVRIPSGNAPDGVMRCRGGVLERYFAGAVVKAAQPAKDRVVLGAWADDRDRAEHAIERMRFALGLDDDFRDFYERFRFDPLIGPSVRARPWLRVFRRPEPFEALAWAVTEQLIDYPRAAAIQRRMVRAFGARCPRTGLRDAPTARAVAGAAPALLESMDLKGTRAICLVKAAREVAAGRVDLHDPDHERGWRRLRTISGIGSWTQDILALHGQGRYDQLPAGDLGYVKFVGFLRSGGDPRVAARATEEEVREFFAPYEGWTGLAGAHALRSARQITPRSPLPAAGRSAGRPAVRAA